MSKNRTYNFVLVLSGVSETDGRVEDALYDAGCDDATLAFRAGIAYLEFDRRADSFEKAIVSAVHNVERSGLHLEVSRIEPGDLVTASEIARRIHRSREYVRLLVEGKRGAGGFPPPRSGVSATTLVWSWCDVIRWFSEYGVLQEVSSVYAAELLRDLNDALEMRSDPSATKRRQKYVRELSKENLSTRS